MKKFLLIIPWLFCLLFQLGCGSSNNDNLIGKWKENSSSDAYYEFMKSGSFTKTTYSTSDGKWYMTSGKDNAGNTVNYLMLEYSGGEKKSLRIISLTGTDLEVENESGRVIHLQKL